MNINIEEINAIKFNVIKNSHFSIGKIKIRKGYIFGFLEFIRLLFYYLYSCSFRFPKKDVHNRILYLYGTKNGKKALEPVFKIEQTGIFFNIYDLPIYRAYLYSIPYIFTFVRYIKLLSKEKRVCVKRYFASFWSAYGYYILARKIISHYNLKAVVVPNDHGELFRALILACNDVSIDSYYLQHASVTEKFPKLICKYALLDGEDSLEKYTISDNCQKVFVIGGSRFDMVDTYVNSIAKKNVLGIALTLSDDLERIEKLCLQLKDINSFLKISKVILRPHPRMNLHKILLLCNKYDFCFSNPLIEDSLLFLRNINFLIANESSIHLDAAIMRVPSVLYSPMSKLGFRDHYSYVKNGLVIHVDHFERLCLLIKEAKVPMNAELVKKFNQSFGSIYEGHVSNVINDIINNYSLGKPFELEYFVERNGVCWLV